MIELLSADLLVISRITLLLLLQCLLYRSFKSELVTSGAGVKMESLILL